MIRNLLYSLSLHLLLILIVYLNFNFQEFVETPSNQPITVSFVALKEENFPKINDSKEVAKIEKKEVEPKPKKIVKKSEKKQKKEKIKEKSKKKKVSKKKTSSKKSKKKAKKESKKHFVKAKEENKNVEKIQTINLSARERINVRFQIKKCYKKAIQESSSSSPIPIKVNVNLKTNGTISIPSLKILNKEEFKGFPEDLKIALKNAKKALKLCSPLRNLPKDKYEIWQEIELVFDANE